MGNPFRMFLARSRKDVLALLISLVIVFVVNQICFSSSFYSRIFSGATAAGQVMLMVRAEESRVKLNLNNKTAIIFGDSRLAEGFSAKQATAMTQSFGLEVVNSAIPSTTPRCWYYFLKKLDPQSVKYDYIVLGVPSLVKLGNENLKDRILDLDYLAPILKPGDYWEVAQSFTTVESKTNVLRMLSMKGFVYKYDFQDLFLHPQTRAKDILNPYVSVGWSHNYDYPGRSESLDGVMWDQVKKMASFPKDYSSEQQEFVKTYIKSLDEIPNQENLDYYLYWLGQILKKYENSNTKIIVFQVPAGPLPTTAPGARAFSQITDLKISHPNLQVLPADLFRELEKPELFFDYLHLNSLGRQKLTQELTNVLLSIHKKPEPN